MYDDEDPKQLQQKSAVAFLYYGLLRKCESIKVQVNDVFFNHGNHIEVNYPYHTKRQARGFSFKIPGWLKPSFSKYLNQVPDGAKKGSSFLKNYSKAKNGKVRIQNMDSNTIADLVKGVASWLIKDRKVTTHSFCRRGASALAESGISISGICHAGRWSSIKVAQEYTEHTEYEKTGRVEQLDGEKVRSAEKSGKCQFLCTMERR